MRVSRLRECGHEASYSGKFFHAVRHRSMRLIDVSVHCVVDMKMYAYV